MRRKISIERATELIKNGGILIRRPGGNFDVFERYTRENHPEYFVGLRDDYKENQVLVGFISPTQYKKIFGGK